MKWCAALTVLCTGMTHAQPLLFSGSLPVLFINTADSIKSKTEYVDGTYYLDNMGMRNIQSIGSADEPLPMQIRGRGNWTWTGPFEKKPYKLKLAKKQALAGMSANKHFALLAHADGDNPFFRNAAAFMMSRQLGLDFTPVQQPVELMLNGAYEGLYFLTETVRVGKDRVNITEQADMETDSLLVTGGWLIELDNARDEHQLHFSTKGTNLGWLWVTYHSPEKLSIAQQTYLRTQIETMKKAIYTTDKSSTDWEKIIDVPTLARYYLIYEVLDNPEGFLGSCFLHKDRAEEKWKFGPVWDLGNALSRAHPEDDFCYNYHNGWYPGLINEIVKFPRFQEEVLKVWNEFYPDQYIVLRHFFEWYYNYIRLAADCDRARWGYSPTLEEQLTECLDMLEEKKNFLLSQWSTASSIANQKVAPLQDDDNEILFSLSGQQLQRPPSKGIYIKGNKKYVKRNNRGIW